jgi:dolichyl-diphosphooligosaccharide--protein glycosyltransferase
MRIVEQTMYGENPGVYQFYSEDDPLLNYPLGASGGRKPIMNMMAIFMSQFATPFMDEIDALGLSMQFLPALFGALLVFPVYFLGKELFSRKVGLLAAFFLVLIPVHLGSGHGSAFALFDHDSFNLFMIITTYLFLIKSLRAKDSIKSMIYAGLGGMTLAGLQMVWVEAEFLFTIIALYAIVQMVVDIFTSKVSIQVPRTFAILMFTGYFISLPVIAARGSPINLELFLCLGVAAFGALYYLFDRKNIPWTLSLPIVFIITVLLIADVPASAMVSDTLFP